MNVDSNQSVQTNLTGFVCEPFLNKLCLGISTPWALLIAGSVVFAGTTLNSFVIYLLFCMSHYANQDVYVIMMSVAGLVMAGPALSLHTYGNAVRCYLLPQMISDLRIFTSQICAGLQIWLVCLIGVDRFLMVCLHGDYSRIVSKRRTWTAILSVSVYYVVVCGCVNVSPYVAGTFTERPLSMPTDLRYKFASYEGPTTLGKCLNYVRMFTDRLMPFVVCFFSYAAILGVRRRQKSRLDTRWGVTRQTVGPVALDHDLQVERQLKRSKRLVTAIHVSMLVFQTPETFFDVSLYVFGHSFRQGPWELFGLVWYFQTIINPLIYLLTIPALRRRAQTCFRTLTKILGLSGNSINTEKTTSTNIVVINDVSRF